MPHVKFAYNYSVSAATGLAPTEVHMNRLPRLSLTIFEQHYARGHQSLARDQLEYCDLAADRQRRAYALVREQHAITVSRVERRNSALSDAFKQRPSYTIGSWVWIYNTAATIRQGAKSGTGAKVLKRVSVLSKLLLSEFAVSTGIRPQPCKLEVLEWVVECRLFDPFSKFSGLFLFMPEFSINLHIRPFRVG